MNLKDMVGLHFLPLPSWFFNASNGFEAEVVLRIGDWKRYQVLLIWDSIHAHQMDIL